MDDQLPALDENCSHMQLFLESLEKHHRALNEIAERLEAKVNYVFAREGISSLSQPSTPEKESDVIDGLLNYTLHINERLDSKILRIHTAVSELDEFI